ncbi:hypothetical protein J2Z60_000985 [Lactobacillus colini]|uniref:DUF3397 domain-containing protein n=1 Tax=Lactobacillus colini TaxID=1819254 RepID=A0ABS4MDP9_9LACO|nr:DUF3397 family protein [Lactobacillus colini]MBP2057813.1 hypothetical protein [Lactobacillus colini]
MQLLWIFLVPVIGILSAGALGRIFPKAQFKGYDVLPFFFIVACQLITNYKKEPTFLPYGLWVYFILVVIVAVFIAIRNKNISMGSTIRILWDYLVMCSVFWYIGLIVLLLLD